MNTGFRHLLTQASSYYMTTAMILVERLLQSEEPVAETKLAARHACLPSVLTSNAGHIVNMLLAQQPVLRSPVAEASVHRGTRSRNWNAVFTGAAGGQVWKSTGLTDRDQALLVARKWEAEARAERAKLGRTARKPILRVRPSEPGTRVGGLTQKEVALPEPFGTGRPADRNSCHPETPQPSTAAPSLATIPGRGTGGRAIRINSR